MNVSCEFKKKMLILLICFLSVILIVAIGIAIWLHGGPFDAKDATNASATTSMENPAPKPENDRTQIETPYGTLHYGDVFVEYLQVSITEAPVYQVQFIANIGPTPVFLFDIRFGGETGQYLGYLEANGEAVEVYTVLHELKRTADLADEDMIMLYTMQEQINQIIEHLPLKYHEELQQITTTCGTLKLNEAYSQRFRVEQKDQTFAFYAALDNKPQQYLFTLSFGSGEGDCVGTAADAQSNPVEVYVQMGQLEFDQTWTETEKDTVFAMQEELNSLLDQLSLTVG